MADNADPILSKSSIGPFCPATLEQFVVVASLLSPLPWMKV